MLRDYQPINQHKIYFSRYYVNWWRPPILLPKIQFASNSGEQAVLARWNDDILRIAICQQSLKAINIIMLSSMAINTAYASGASSHGILCSGKTAAFKLAPMEWHDTISPHRSACHPFHAKVMIDERATLCEYHRRRWNIIYKILWWGKKITCKMIAGTSISHLNAESKPAISRNLVNVCFDLPDARHFLAHYYLPIHGYAMLVISRSSSSFHYHPQAAMIYFICASGAWK